MKKCVPRNSDRIISYLTIAFLCGGSVFFFYKLIYGGDAPLFFLAAGIVLGGVATRLLYKTITMGNWGFFYDDEKIIFVLSRKDCREIRWDQLQGAKESFFYFPSPGSGYFSFPDKKKIGISSRMTGYEGFMAAIKEKGFSAAKPYDPNQFDDPEELKKIFNSVFGEEMAGRFKGKDTQSWSWPKKKK